MCGINWSKPLKYVGGSVFYEVELLPLPPRTGMNNSQMKLITLTDGLGGHVIVCTVNDRGYEVHPDGVIGSRRMVENAPEEVEDYVLLYRTDGGTGEWAVCSSGGNTKKYLEDMINTNSYSRNFYRVHQIVKVK